MTEVPPTGPRTAEVLAVLDLDSGDLTELVAEHPWIATLPDQEIALLLLENAELRRGATIGQIARFWAGWERAAAVYADPELRAALARSRDRAEGGPR